MKNKPIVRLNPELERLIEIAKKETMDMFNGKNFKGLNQVAQIKVAEWAVKGKYGNAGLIIPRPPKELKKKQFRDRWHKIMKDKVIGY